MRASRILARRPTHELVFDLTMDQHTIISAAVDFRYLLGRGYPRQAALTLVGNRYDLPAEERDVLHRGVHPDDLAAERRAKLIAPNNLAGRRLAIDGHNVIITVESALMGRFLVRCDDGVIRDVARLSHRYRPGKVTDRAVEMITGFLAGSGIIDCRFFLDGSMSKSGELAGMIRGVMARRGVKGDASAVKVPEREIEALGYVTATSDSVLMDGAAEVFDLGGHIALDQVGREDVLRLI